MYSDKLYHIIGRFQEHILSYFVSNWVMDWVCIDVYLNNIMVGRYIDWL